MSETKQNRPDPKRPVIITRQGVAGIFTGEQAKQHAEHSRMQKRYQHLIHDEAPLHAAKELGGFYDVALDYFRNRTGGDTTKALELMHDKVAHQLWQQERQGHELRTQDGYIILGHLNLKELGLSDQQCSDIVEMRSYISQKHPKESAYLLDQDLSMRAVKELGNYLGEAIDNKGSMKAVTETISAQLPQLQEEGAVIRKGSRIKIGLVNLDELLSPESAAIRRSLIATSKHLSPSSALETPATKGILPVEVAPLHEAAKGAQRA